MHDPSPADRPDAGPPTPRQEQVSEWQAHRLVDRTGQPFEQLRQVPLGSNWPSGVPGRPPRPGVVAIRRLDGSPLA